MDSNCNSAYKVKNMFIRCEFDDFLDTSTVKTEGDVRFLHDKFMEEFLES